MINFFTSTKFILGVLGLAATVWITLEGKMDGNAMLAISVCVGGPVAGNTLITRAALASGKDPNGVNG